MKKNWTLRIAGLLALAVIVTLTFVGGTFAKYTKTVTGTDTARVAKFSVSAGDLATAFNLFDTVDANVDVDGSGEETVIAPGTAGSFEVEVKNDSEVAVAYAIELSVTNSNNIPLLWSTDGVSYNAEVPTLSGETLAIGAEATSLTVYWKWAFEGNDVTDTALGEAGTAVVSATITVTFTQVD